VGADQTIEDLAQGQRQLVAVFVEHALHLIEELPRLCARPPVVDKPARSNAYGTLRLLSVWRVMALDCPQKPRCRPLMSYSTASHLGHLDAVGRGSGRIRVAQGNNNELEEADFQTGPSQGHERIGTDGARG
jgi:hypothetical protein